jgi:hypothetical protein
MKNGGAAEMEDGRWGSGVKKNTSDEPRKRALEKGKTCRYRHAVMVHTQVHCIDTQQKGRHNEEA